MRTGRTTAIKKAEAAGVTYKGSAATTTIAPSVNAPSSKQRIQQARERLVREQRAQNDSLRREQNSEVLKERIKNQVKLAGLQTEQLSTRAEQKLEQDYDLASLKLNTAQVAAQGQLNVAGTAAAGQVAQQNAAVVGTIAKSLVQLSGTFAKTHIQAQANLKEYQESLNLILGPDPSSDGIWSETEILELQEKQRQQVRIAGEQAIQNVAPGDPLGQQEIRHNNATAYAANVSNQNDNLRFASSIGAGLSDFMTSGELVEIPGLGLIDPRQVRTKSQLAAALRKGIGLQVIDWLGRGGKLDLATVKTIRTAAEKAFNYEMQIWGPKIEKARIDAAIDLSNTQAKEQLKLKKPIQEIYNTWVANTMPITGDTKQSINKKAVEQFIKIIDNPDDLLALKSVQQVPGQKGTELGNHPEHSLTITKAIIELDKTNDALEVIAVEKIEDNMYQELFKLDEKATPADREAVINKAIYDAERSGATGIKWAFDVRKKLEELASPGGIEANAKRLNLDIIEGRVRTELDINRQFAMGYIDKRRRDGAIQLLKDTLATGKVQNKLARNLVDTEVRSLKTELYIAAGLKADMNGNAYDPATTPDSTNALLEPYDADRIANSMGEDVRRIVNTFIAQNPDLKDPRKERELLDGIRNEIKLWKESNLLNPNGKYYLPEPLIEAKGKIKGRMETNPALKTRLEELRDDVNLRPTIYNSKSSIIPKDWTGYISLKEDDVTYFDAEIRELYNPRRGDKLISLENLEDIMLQWEAGDIDEGLQNAADVLKITPRELLNQQVKAHGLDKTYRFLPDPAEGDQASNVDWTPPSQEIAQIASTQTAGLLAQAQEKKSPINSYQGALYLIKNHGLPHKGAAWLSGNIEQESTWDGQRKPWILDDGAGTNKGLVSWNRDRITAAETYLGRPIEQSTNAEQLDYMIHELSTVPYYRKAYEIFMNPWSSDRDLKRASIIFWGYGDEGSRYQYAQDTFNQLITPPPINE